MVYNKVGDRSSVIQVLKSQSDTKHNFKTIKAE